MLPHVAYPRNIAAYSPKYAAIFNITNSPEFEDALGVLSWQAQRVLTRAFKNLEKFEHGMTLWGHKETYKVSLVEEQVNDALEKYQEKNGDPIDYSEYFYPVIEELHFGQSLEIRLEMQYFITAKAIYEYVSNFKDKPSQENFNQFRTIANLITTSIEFMSLELRKDQISIEAETFAKKPFPRQPTPKHRFSAVSIPNHSSILPQYPLNPPWIPDNQASGPPFRRQQAHLAC